MATQLGNFDGPGVGHTLTTGGEYAVAEGTRVLSDDAFGIKFDIPSDTPAQRLDLTIAGQVQGGFDYEAIDIDGNSGSQLHNIFIRVTGTGVVSGGESGDGIRASNSYNGTVAVENAGTIVGTIGLSLEGSGLKTITNSGLIFGIDLAIRSNANLNGAVILRNSGQIVVGNGVALQFYGVGAGANDQVFNSGRILGDVVLGAGADLYDGRGGKLIGELNGGLGNDRFIPGAARDSITGGDGEDVLDFRSTKGVNVALDNAFAKTGAARGDTYTEIENIYGSLTGADKLRGDAQSNDLFGFGGADTLVGAAGNDRLNGGLGRDLLTGGADSDIFVFNSLGERGDVITDFAGGFSVTKDGFYINLKGFGLSGTTFKQGWYREGNSNVAQDRDDHFIFRKTDTTLWFDADGKGGRGPVLLANLQAGAELDWTQFNNL